MQRPGVDPAEPAPTTASTCVKPAEHVFLERKNMPKHNMPKSLGQNGHRWLFTSLRLPILAPTGCGLTRCPLGTFDHGLVRDGIDGDRLLRQAVEESPSIAGPTPVESKREFVEVVFQVLVAHRSLMSSQNPALQQRCDAVHARHQFRRGFLLTLQEGYVMCVASPFERIVADPPVGMHGAAWLNRLFHEIH